MMRTIIIAAVLIFLPVVICSLFTRKQNDTIQKRVRYAVSFSVLLAAGVAVCAAVRPSWTVYEYVVFEYICSILLMFFFQVILEKKRINVQLILSRLCLIGAGIAVYSVLTCGQASMNSDTASAVLLAQSQIRHKSIFPDTWAYANGELWFLSLELFTLPFTFFMKNQSLARQMASVARVLVTVLCMYIQDKKVTKNNSWIISIPAVLIFMQGCIDVNLYSAAYMGVLLWIVVFTLLVYMILYEKYRRWMVLLFIFLNLSANVIGLRCFAELVVPLWLACTAMLYFENKDNPDPEWKKIWKRFGFYTGLIVLPAAVSYGMIYKTVCRTHTVNQTVNGELIFTDSLQGLWDNLITVILDMFENFGFSGGAGLFTAAGIQNMVSVSVCLLLVFIIPVLQAKKIRKETKGVQFLFAFMVFHNFIFLLLGVLFGKASTGRYMLSMEYISVMVSSGYMMKYWIGNRRQDCRLFWTVMVFSASVLSAATMLKKSVGWDGVIESRKQFARELVSRGLDEYKGYATYWNAYVTEIYSDLELRFAAVNGSAESPGLTPFQWLVDTERFDPQDQGSFLLLSAEENQSVGNGLEHVYGKTKETFLLHDMYVYVWDHDIAKNGFLSWKDETDYTDRMLLSGAVRDEPVIWSLRDGQFIYGPYLNLKAGSYRLVIDADLEKETECVITADSGKRNIKTYRLKPGMNEIAFGLEEMAFQVEFPIYSKEGSRIKLRRVMLEDTMTGTRTDYTAQMCAGQAENIGEKTIYIPENAYIYGPYLYLEAGRYLLSADVEMTGEVLCRITSAAGTETITEYLLKPGHNEVEFALQEDAYGVELPVASDGTGTIKVKNISLKKK